MDRFVLGITGGIAAGKSTLSQFLAKKGACIIDADKISASILKKGTEAYDKVSQEFPSCILNGELDRRALGKIVFNDAGELSKLNIITHPAIIKQIKNEVAAKKGIVAIDAALLFETGLEKLCDSVWCVTAPKNIRIQRIIDRNGLTHAEALSRIESQMNDDDRRSRSDVVIDTTIDREEYESLINAELSVLLKEMES